MEDIEELSKRINIELLKQSSLALRLSVLADKRYNKFAKIYYDNNKDIIQEYVRKEVVKDTMGIYEMPKDAEVLSLDFYSANIHEGFVFRLELCGKGIKDKMVTFIKVKLEEFELYKRVKGI